MNSDAIKRLPTLLLRKGARIGRGALLRREIVGAHGKLKIEPRDGWRNSRLVLAARAGRPSQRTGRLTLTGG
jgi:hypothetical protein